MTRRFATTYGFPRSALRTCGCVREPNYFRPIRAGGNLMMTIALSLAFGVINLAYVMMGVAGFVRGRAAFGIGMLLAFVVLRSIFLGSLENPEPRYTLECFPALIVAASALFLNSSF
jgi:hypothetical protein